jgi:hypothetical protein
MVKSLSLVESILLAVDAAHQMREEDVAMWEVIFILTFASYRNCAGTAGGCADG